MAPALKDRAKRVKPAEAVYGFSPVDGAWPLRPVLQGGPKLESFFTSLTVLSPRGDKRLASHFLWRFSLSCGDPGRSGRPFFARIFRADADSGYSWDESRAGDNHQDDERPPPAPWNPPAPCPPIN